jgi:hypothetical protein
MTWTKLGDEWSDEARDLSDAAYRTHVDALGWSNRRGLDLLIPKRDIKRFAETADPDTAIKELEHTGWWDDRGDVWFLGLRFADWQLERRVVDQRREATALRVRRHRLHEADDHSICLPKNCTNARAEASRNPSPNALRNGLPGTGRDGSVRDGHEEALSSLHQDQQREGERGSGGEPLPFPTQCAEHQVGPHNDPCRACGRARTSHDEQQAQRTREAAQWPQQYCADPAHARQSLPCAGCAADAKAAA